MGEDAGMAGKSGSRRSLRPHRAERWDYFVTIVDFRPLKEADDAFRAWLAEHRLDRADIGERNVVIDTGRGEAGPVRRYRVHRDAVPR